MEWLQSLPLRDRITETLSHQTGGPSDRAEVKTVGTNVTCILFPFLVCLLSYLWKVCRAISVPSWFLCADCQPSLSIYSLVDVNLKDLSDFLLRNKTWVPMWMFKLGDNVAPKQSDCHFFQMSRSTWSYLEGYKWVSPKSFVLTSNFLAFSIWWSRAELEDLILWLR